MVKDTFRGGVHPDGHKELSRDVPLREFLPAGEMVFPLSQHIGKPAKPIVKKGDAVLMGQRIAEADGFVSAHIIASCSGTVKAIEKRRILTGTMADCIVIDNDGQFTPAADYTTREDPSKLSNDELIQRVQDAAIVGLGGAGFPTHVKLKPKNPDAIRFVIANGAECEPYLTCNDQLMRSQADAIVEGLELTLRLFKNAEGVIAIERNKPEAIAAMQKAAAGKAKIKVLGMVTKYPQGGAHTLTLTGEAVANPGNWIVHDGTLFSELLEHAGGIKSGVTLKKAMCGGPMMGIAMGSLDVPIQKQNNGLTLLAEDPNEIAEAKMTACLRCGRCATVCPVGLLPQPMSEAAADGDYERFEKRLYGLECIQCGSCTFACPAKRPLMQLFKQAKSEILARKRAEAGGKK